MVMWIGRRAALGAIAGLLAASAVRRASAAGNACDVTTVEKAAYCPVCKKLLEAGEVEGGKHKACGAAVQDVDVCVKAGFECPACKTVTGKAGPCPTCGKTVIPKAIKARVVYRCPKCGHLSDKPGTCPNPPCGAPELKKTCERSGKAPHVGA
jgi:predicted RNA-binding Zn-ribbon protein involved in translation (DUF1610 family)